MKRRWILTVVGAALLALTLSGCCWDDHDWSGGDWHGGHGGHHGCGHHGGGGHGCR